MNQRVADRPPEEQGQGRDDELDHPRRRMARGEPCRHQSGGAGAGQRRCPEPPAEGRVLPAHVDDARVGTPSRALPLDHAGARQPPVGRVTLQQDVLPDAEPARHDVAGHRRSPEGGPAALDDHLEPAAAREPEADGDAALEELTRVPDPHRVGAEVVAVLARGLPLHHVVGEAAGPALDVRLARELHRHPDQLIGNGQRQPVVVRHEVVARPPGGAAEGGHALGAALLLDEGDQPLGEDAVDLARHRPLPPMFGGQGHFFRGSSAGLT